MTVFAIIGAICFTIGYLLATFIWRRRLAAQAKIARNDIAYYRKLANEHRPVRQMEIDFDIFTSSPTKPGKVSGTKE